MLDKSLVKNVPNENSESDPETEDMKVLLMVAPVT